jgi:hypothetical protein
VQASWRGRTKHLGRCPREQSGSKVILAEWQGFFYTKNFKMKNAKRKMKSGLKICNLKFAI